MHYGNIPLRGARFWFLARRAWKKQVKNLQQVREPDLESVRIWQDARAEDEKRKPAK